MQTVAYPQAENDEMDEVNKHFQHSMPFLVRRRKKRKEE